MGRSFIKPGEQIIYQGHPCWRAIIGFYLKGILASLVLVAIMHFLLGQDVSFTVLILVVLVSLTVLIGFIKRWATVYTITSKRLNIRRGIIARDIQETRLERIQNVQSQQSVYQRLMRIGDVEFDTAGTDDSNFFFYGVDNPLSVADRVNSAIADGAAGSQGLGAAQA